MRFLYDDFYQLLRDIVSKFIIPGVLEKCKSASSFCHIDFMYTKNQLKKLEIGLALVDYSIKNKAR